MAKKVSKKSQLIKPMAKDKIAEYVEDLFKNPDKLLSVVVPRLMPADFNRGVTTMNVLDLTLTFCVNVPIEGTEETAAVYVPADLLDEEGKILSAAALHNFKSQILNLSDITHDEMLENYHLYVVTNEEMWYGAVAILDNKLLKELADKVDDDLAVYPASVHEMIITPWEYAKNDIENLKKMIAEINNVMVKDIGILSDSMYHYSRGSQKLTII